MEPSPPPSTIESAPPQPTIEPEKVVRPSNKHVILIGIFIILFCFLIALSGYILIKKTNLPPAKPNPQQFNNIGTNPSPNQQIAPAIPQSGNLETYINCLDVRDVVEDGDIDYIACLGGVLMINSKTGKIIDEINFADGLSSNTVTSLALVGGKLYIGTQLGINIYDLMTKKITQIAATGGLPSDHNIALKYDDPTLWIGTFKGIASMDSQTLTVTTYNSELTGVVDNPVNGVGSMLETPDAMYFYMTANVNSRGYVVRFDKNSRTWRGWGPNTFGLNDRIDIISLAYSGGKVYAFDYKEYWVANDSADASWKKSTQIYDEINKIKKNTNCTIRQLESDTEKIYFTKCNNLFVFDPADNSTKHLIAQFDASKNLPFIKYNYLWVFSMDGKNFWLNKLPLEGNTNITFKETRPMEFYKAIAVVNGRNAFISTNDGLMRLDLSDNNRVYKKIVGPIDQLTDVKFIPILDSNYVLLFLQDCGMGCSEPLFYLYDYLKGDVQKITLSDPVKKMIASETWYFSVVYDGSDSGGVVVFSAQDKDQKFAYNANSGKWITDYNGDIVYYFDQPNCGIIVSFSDDTGFSNSECSNEKPLLPNVYSSVKTGTGFIGTIENGGLFITK